MHKCQCKGEPASACLKHRAVNFVLNLHVLVPGARGLGKYGLKEILKNIGGAVMVNRLAGALTSCNDFRCSLVLPLSTASRELPLASLYPKFKHQSVLETKPSLSE